MAGTTAQIVKIPVVPVVAQSNFSEYLLPLEIEIRLCNDLSFLSANEAGVNSVAAACIEEGRNGDGLTLLLAANAGVSPQVRKGLLEIWEAIVYNERSSK